jgi:hypothetical protein
LKNLPQLGFRHSPTVEIGDPCGAPHIELNGIEILCDVDDNLGNLEVDFVHLNAENAAFLLPENGQNLALGLGLGQVFREIAGGLVDPGFRKVNPAFVGRRESATNPPDAQKSGDNQSDGDRPKEHANSPHQDFAGLWPQRGPWQNLQLIISR